MIRKGGMYADDNDDEGLNFAEYKELYKWMLNPMFSLASNFLLLR